MKPQEAVVKETRHIALGTGAMCVVMLIVYCAIRRFSLAVALGTLVGFVLAVGNFFLMGMTVQKIAETLEPDNKEDMARAKLKMRSSYMSRMLLIGVVIFAATRIDLIDWVPVAIPLLFPRITIAIMGILKKRAPKGSEF